MRFFEDARSRWSTLRFLQYCVVLVYFIVIVFARWFSGWWDVQSSIILACVATAYNIYTAIPSMLKLRFVIVNPNQAQKIRFYRLSTELSIFVMWGVVLLVMCLPKSQICQPGPFEPNYSLWYSAAGLAGLLCISYLITPIMIYRQGLIIGDFPRAGWIW